jgi:hypothetical protein
LRALEASDWHGAYTWAKGWIGDGRDTCRLSGGSVDCGSPHARPSLHHYFDIELDVLCSTIVVDLPALLGVVPRPVAET